MPPKKTAADKQAAKDEQIIPRKRGQGVTFRFPTTTGYPLFWLKHAAISSALGQSPYSGNVQGEIKDLNSDPAYLGRPTYFLAHGDFPKQGIAGFDAKITLDHTTEKSRDSLDLTVGSFPVDRRNLSSSPDVKLAIAQAKGSSVMHANLVDEALDIDIKTVFSAVKYDLEAKNAQVKEIIGRVLNGIPKVDVNARIQGSLSDFNVHINSNLGDELAKGFQKQLQAKVAEAQAQLHKIIDDKIGGEKAQLKQQLDKTLGPITKEIDGKKAEANKAVQEAKSQVDKGKSSGTDRLKEEGKKLLKGFGFGG
jgi:uncharacterized protein (TIGR03545 family)